MKKPYQVWVGLGSKAEQFKAAYATRKQAQAAVDFWRTQRGAVNGEPFHATLLTADSEMDKHTY